MWRSCGRARLPSTPAALGVVGLRGGWGGGVCFCPLSDLDFSKLKMNHISNSYEAHFVQSRRSYGTRFLQDSKGGLWPRVSAANRTVQEFSAFIRIFRMLPW